MVDPENAPKPETGLKDVGIAVKPFLCIAGLLGPCSGGQERRKAVLDEPGLRAAA